MKKTTIQSAVVIAAFIVSACGNTDTRVSTTGPSAVNVESATLSVNPQRVDAGTLVSTGTFCPATSPFIVPVNLIVIANGVNTLFVTQITMDFVDVFGVRMPSVTMPAPLLSRQFGTALVDARSSRTFPLTLGVGCGTDRRGTVTVIVDTTDSSGRRSSGRVTLTVR
jgi:hypothetical protein